jgi:two-component system chemotaxis response regulator CheY
MASNCHAVYEEMTSQSAIGTKVDKIEPPFVSARYKTAIVIPFENKKEKIDGRFVLGFNDEQMAIRLAAAIADSTGMPAVDEMDEMARDILFEFMNTVAGKVITDWDNLGLAADFSPPQFVTDLSFQNEGQGELLVNAVSLITQNNEKLEILTSIEEKGTRSLNGKRVLVVDDSKMVRHILVKEFEDQGCVLEQAENGLDGFVRTQAFKPDLIIMDLIMPKMGGLEAIAKIREIDPFVNIIILTSSSKKEEVVAAAAHKVKGYVKKPIKKEQLIALAHSCFEDQ